ncbi:AAA family ATPase [methane-oxidizing endosymbiont of Gigantopelta aegis]|uniref:AAA family ATPase n=1 Tax=methane-oxidizing endosymbiont of Gigantopelta aegis TaxID=2794938 RepID=UPI0018DCE521|nr:AAA family ATPase [methane-oxidizing endosymbiont of Gigantopelta aegis]
MYAHKPNRHFRNLIQQRLLAPQSLPVDNQPEVEPDWDDSLIKVFDVDSMQDMIDKHPSRSNLARNHSRYLEYLGDTEGYLQQAVVPDDIFAQLDQLAHDFPNFQEVVAFYREQLALMVYSGTQVFAATPLLLTGPAGVGKTAFCHRLAQIIQTHFALISFSSMSAGFVLVGMSSNWAEGKPGKVVEALAIGHYANPLMVLDEIDKADGDPRYDPLGSLYQLLESETAAHFIDEGLEVPADCSHIVWVATANDLQRIPEPIVSRFVVIPIKAPNPEQMRSVLASIYRQVRKKHRWGVRFTEQLSEQLVAKITTSEMAPRLIQRELIRACGRASLRHKDNPDNIQLQTDDFYIQNPWMEKEQRPIGFVY